MSNCRLWKLKLDSEEKEARSDGVKQEKDNETKWRMRSATMSGRNVVSGGVIKAKKTIELL